MSCFRLIYITLVVLLSISELYAETLLTACYGSGSCNEHNDIDQGRIYSIQGWKYESNGRVKIADWDADNKQSSANDYYGSASGVDGCSGFTLTSDDFIIGYKVWDGDYNNKGDFMFGIEFYTRNGHTYNCVGDSSKTTHTNSYNYGLYDFWYLTGWKVDEGAIIDGIQFQFTKSTLTASPTSKPTGNPTTTPTVLVTTTNPSITPTFSPSFNPSMSPTEDPSKFPTNNPTDNPIPTPTNNPTPSPTNNPTPSPTNNPIASSVTSYTSDPTINPTSNPAIDRPITSMSTSVSPANTVKNANLGGNDSDGVDYKLLILGLGIGFGVFGGCIILCILYCVIKERAKKNVHHQFKKEGVFDHTVPAEDGRIETKVSAPQYPEEYTERNEIYDEGNYNSTNYAEENYNEQNERTLYYKAQFMQMLMDDGGQQAYLMNMNAIQREQYIESECGIYLQRVEAMYSQNTVPLLLENNNDNNNNQAIYSHGDDDESEDNDGSEDNDESEDGDGFDSHTKSDESNTDENLIEDIEKRGGFTIAVDEYCD